VRGGSRHAGGSALGASVGIDWPLRARAGNRHTLSRTNAGPFCIHSNSRRPSPDAA
jgi:hypothetical protein